MTIDTYLNQLVKLMREIGKVSMI